MSQPTEYTDTPRTVPGAPWVDHEGKPWVTVETLSPEDWEVMVDRIAHREMGISADEFRRRARAGEYRGIDWDAIPGLVSVGMLLLNSDGMLR